MALDPVLHVLAGPNGAGKSTLVERVLQPVTHLPFVNADVIAEQRWPAAAAEHSYEAAQLAAGERTRLIEAGSSFITETVFSHPSKLELLREADQAGYRVTLHVVLITEDLAVSRVADRVRRGGHAVPEDKIRSRYGRLWAHVQEAVLVVDEAYVYDNSDARQPFRIVASFSDGRCVGTPTWPSWTPDALRGRGSKRRSRTPSRLTGG